MTTEMVYEFLALVKTKSFSLAAEELFISAPTLSRHIMALEEQFGTPLFIRGRNEVSLSESGRLFLPYARRIQELETSSQEALSKVHHVKRIPFRLGRVYGLMNPTTEQLISGFLKNNHQFVLEIHDAPAEELHQKLQSGQLDAALVYEDHVHSLETLEALPLLRQQLCAVVLRSHPLAKENNVSIHALENEQLLLMAGDNPSHGLVVNACREAGFEPNITMLSNNVDVLIRPVAHNLGIALVLAQGPMDKGEFTIIPVDKQMEQQVMLLLPQRGKQSFGAQLFLRTIGLTIKETWP